MKKRHFKKYIAPYASSDNQFRRDPNFQIFDHDTDLDAVTNISWFYYSIML